MDPDVIYGIFKIAKAPPFAKLCFMAERIYDDEWLAKWRWVTMQYDKSIDDVIEKFSDEELLLWMQGRELDFLLENIRQIAEDSDMRIPEWKSFSNAHAVLEQAAVRELLGVLGWITKRFNLVKNYCRSTILNIFQATVRAGKVRSLQWLNDIFCVNILDLQLSGYSWVRIAAQELHLPVLRWIKEDLFPKTSEMDIKLINIICLHEAILMGNLKFVKWTIKEFSITEFKPTRSNVRVIRQGLIDHQFQVSDWLLKKFNQDKDFWYARIYMVSHDIAFENP